MQVWHSYNSPWRGCLSPHSVERTLAVLCGAWKIEIINPIAQPDQHFRMNGSIHQNMQKFKCTDINKFNIFKPIYNPVY